MNPEKSKYHEVKLPGTDCVVFIPRQGEAKEPVNVIPVATDLYNQFSDPNDPTAHPDTIKFLHQYTNGQMASTWELEITENINGKSVAIAHGIIKIVNQDPEINASKENEFAIRALKLEEATYHYIKSHRKSRPSLKVTFPTLFGFSNNTQKRREGDTEERFLYLILSKENGVALKDLINNDQINRKQIIEIKREIALEYASLAKSGILYTDQNTGNVLVGEDGQLSIIDLAGVIIIDKENDPEKNSEKVNIHHSHLQVGHGALSVELRTIQNNTEEAVRLFFEGLTLTNILIMSLDSSYTSANISLGNLLNSLYNPAKPDKSRHLIQSMILENLIAKSGIVLDPSLNKSSLNIMAMKFVTDGKLQELPIDLEVLTQFKYANNFKDLDSKVVAASLLASYYAYEVANTFSPTSLETKINVISDLLILLQN